MVSMLRFWISEISPFSFGYRFLIINWFLNIYKWSSKTYAQKNIEGKKSNFLKTSFLNNTKPSRTMIVCCWYIQILKALHKSNNMRQHRNWHWCHLCIPCAYPNKYIGKKSIKFKHLLWRCFKLDYIDLHLFNPLKKAKIQNTGWKCLNSVSVGITI